MHVDVASVETQKLVAKTKGEGETSEKIQKRVQAARKLQSKRFKGTRIKSNSEMKTKDVKKYCLLSPECCTILTTAVSTMNLSARSYFKVIKVARTIADLADAKQISTSHLAESLQYRFNDEEY